MSNVIFRYVVESESDQISARADALLLEQTIELSLAVTRDPWVRENIVGEVLSIEEISVGRYGVALAQPLRATALDPAQFLNVAFGNSSLQADVTLASIEPPEAFFATFKGPRFGIAGLRAKLGIPKRALTSTALKPMGLRPEAMASLVFDFAIAGLDIVKDDHGLADHEFCPFEKRVELCQRAVEKANAETGGATLYAPNLIGAPATLYRQLAFARQAGVGAVMISPMLVGPAFLHELAAAETGLPILAHPAFGGAFRVAPDALFGQVFKWFGADAVIYPHLGGRFSYSRQTCLSLAERLRSAEGGLRPAFPAPAGGIKTSRVREVLEFYGADTLLLVGGSLLETGDVVRSAKAFVAEVETVSSELVG